MARTKTKTPNTEPTPMASSKTKLIRATIDSDTEHSLEKWAQDEGRSVQMHAGILLRRLVKIATDKGQRKTLEDLGLLSTLTAVA